MFLIVDYTGLIKSTIVGIVIFACSCHSNSLFAQSPFITTWVTSDGQIVIPTTGTGYNYSLTWTNLINAGVGDGSISGQTGDYSITGLENGSTYQVEITGIFPRIYFNETGDKDKIMTIEQWGDIAWTSMEGAFAGCTNLTYNAVDAPNLSGVTNMERMFSGATLFDGNINNWDVSNVTDMDYLFGDTNTFNSPLDLWDVSNVTSMVAMFSSADAFNQPLNNWNVSSLISAQYMFLYADVFNQPLNNWDVSNVVSMTWMFAAINAFSPFDQDLSQWDIGSVTDLNSIFSCITGGLSTTNYDATLEGWARLDPGETQIPINLTMEAQGRTYSSVGVIARNILTNTYGWTITGDSYSGTAPFITTWVTTNGQITIPTTTGTYNYSVTWTNLTNAGIGDGSIAGQTGDYTITGLENGSTYLVEISGTFPRIHFNNGNEGQDTNKIMTIEQWGNIAWSSMENAFYGCTNLTLPASDAPDLSGATSLDRMFSFCNSLNSDINNWDVSTIQTFLDMFYSATSFNGNISNWDLSSAVNLQGMFGFTPFNQPLDNWNVSSVSFMPYMFWGSSYNQPLSNWDVSSVSNMTFMFNSTPFDQDLSTWDISSVIDMTNMLSTSGMSTTNYDATLQGWSTLDVGEAQIPTGIPLGATGITFCDGGDARDDLINTYTWTITDGGFSNSCAFVTTWQTTTTNESITIPTTGAGYNYTVNWGDGTEETGFTGDATHIYATAGTYTVAIIGDFPNIYFNGGNEGQHVTKIMTIENWGDIAWSTMLNSFDGCSNLVLNALDAPDLSMVTDVQAMFRNTQVNSPIDHWDVSNVQAFASMLQGTPFDQNIGTWNMSNATGINALFAFTPFNQDISGWNVSNVTGMSWVFENNSVFNQDISSWNVSSVTSMFEMFENATSFNQDLGSWDISAVADMGNMLSNSGLSTANYDTTLQGWATLDTGESQIPSNITLGASGLTYCDGETARDNLISTYSWTVIGDSRECVDTDFVAFSFPEQTGPASINNLNSTIEVEVVYNAKLGNLVADYSLSNGASVQVGGTIQLSGSSINDFTNPITYVVTAQDGITTENWTVNVTQEATPDEFITTWGVQTLESDPQASELTITIPTETGLTYNYSVDWGDGAVETGITGDATHTYNIGDLQGTLDLGGNIYKTDTFTVSITGDFPHFFMDPFRSDLDRYKLKSIENWGNIAWASMQEAFYGSTDMIYNAVDAPNLTNVNSLSYMFTSCFLLDGDFSNWDLSNITDISGMFAGASVFDGAISTWNTSNVTNMSSVFENATSFNGDISNWNTSNVESMGYIFSGASSFNGDVTGWDVANVFGTVDMFKNATSFDQNLGSWNLFGNLVSDEFNTYFYNMSGFFDNSGMSALNYDLTLDGWARLDAGETWVPTNVPLSAAGINYCDEEARTTLINDYNWSFSGDTKDCTGVPSNETDILTFSFAEENTAAVIDDVNFSIDIEVVFGTDISSLVPTFTLSTNAMAEWNSAALESGTTAMDYSGSSSQTITVTAENGINVRNWLINVTVDDQLTAYYPFNNNANDESGNGYDGTIVGEVTFESDRLSNANAAAAFSPGGLFDGIDARISIPSNSFLGSSGNVTISLWVFQEDGPQTDRFLLDHAQTDLILQGIDNTLRWDMSDVSIFSDYVFPLDTWVHVVLTTDGSTSKIYYDAVLDTTVNQGVILSTTGNASIGSSNNNEFKFTGKLDDIRFYDRVISTEEIDDLFSEVPSALSSENDILSYNFSEQTGPATIDAVNHTVNIEVASGVNLANLIATFSISGGSSAKINDVDQVSGTTSNDFTNPVTYTITAEIGVVQNWLVTVTKADSPSGPTISFLSQPSSSFLVGSGTLTLSVNANDNEGISGVNLVHSPIRTSENAWTTISATNDTGDMWSADITEAMMDEMGIALLFEANDTDGNTTKTDTVYILKSYDSSNAPQIPSANIGVGGKAENWRMFSIPYDLNNTQISTIFEAALGAYDKSRWRLVRYNASTDGFSEYKSGLSSIELGKGYWINTIEQASIFIGPGQIKNVSGSLLATIPLDNGWTQIGNPYPFDIDWADVISFNSSSAGGLKVYTGGTSLSDATTLGAFDGAYVFSDDGTDVTVPFVTSPTSRARTREVSNSIDQEHWEINIVSKSGQFSNQTSKIGMSTDASEGKDKYDAMRVPRFVKYTDLTFQHPEFWYPWFAGDIVPRQETYTWEFTSSNNTGESNRIIWDNSIFGDNDYQLYLEDLENGKIVSMREESFYAYKADSSRTFKIHYGHSDMALKEVSLDLKLGSPYPNPFNTSTIIPFTLPDKDARFNVRLEILDILGNQIDVLMDKPFESGLHRWEWNGQDASGINVQSGFYMVVMKVTSDQLNYTLSKKILKQ